MNVNSPEFQDPIFINNAGLIILAPFLGKLFEKCELTNQNEFIDEQSKSKAVYLLTYAATGSTEAEEYHLVLNKILCGMSISDQTVENIILTEEDIELVDSLLFSVIQNWGKMQNTSIDGLRDSFLQRQGRLEEKEEQYYLEVEQKAFDILLDQLQWRIDNIKLAWMKKDLLVDWR